MMEDYEKKWRNTREANYEVQCARNINMKPKTGANPRTDASGGNVGESHGYGKKKS